MKEQQPTARVTCSICGRQLPPSEVVPGELVRPSIVAAIGRDHPKWTVSDPVCLDDLNHYRALSVQEIQTELMEEVATHRRAVEPRG